MKRRLIGSSALLSFAGVILAASMAQATTLREGAALHDGYASHDGPVGKEGTPQALPFWHWIAVAACAVDPYTLMGGTLRGDTRLDSAASDALFDTAR